MTTGPKTAPRRKAAAARPKSGKPHQAKAKRKPASATAAAPKAKPAGNGGWGSVAVLGAAGAGIAALVYAMGGKRTKGRRGDDWPAHQADGRNSSDQFAAQIADENMIPERVPEAIV